MKEDTFGSPKVYPALNCINDYVSRLDDNRANYIGHFLHQFNSVLKELDKINDRRFYIYVLKLIRKDFTYRLSELGEKGYETTLITHMQNFIYGKIRAIIKEKDINKPFKKI